MCVAIARAGRVIMFVFTFKQRANGPDDDEWFGDGDLLVVCAWRTLSMGFEAIGALRLNAYDAHVRRSLAHFVAVVAVDLIV